MTIHAVLLSSIQSLVIKYPLPIYRRLRSGARYVVDRLFRRRNAIWAIEGSLPRSQVSIRLIVAGSLAHANRMHSIYFNKLGEFRRIADVSGLALKRRAYHYLDTLDGDAAFWEPWPWQVNTQRKDIFFTHMDAVLDLESDIETLFRKRISNQKHRQKALKIALTPPSTTFSEEESALEFLYERLFKPTTLKRHGAKAFMEPLEKLKRWRSPGEEKIVMLIAEGDEIIGGGLIILNRVSRISLLHITGVSPSCLEDGGRHEDAMNKVYAEFIRHAIAQGMRKANFGATPSLLQDGIHFYKKRWGCRFEVNLDDGIPGNITRFRFTPGNKESLLHEFPILLLEHGKVVGLASLPTNTELSGKEILNYLGRFPHQGMARLDVLYPETFAPENLPDTTNLPCPVRWLRSTCGEYA